MSKEKVYKVLESAKESALINQKDFGDQYQQSISNPDKFWREHGKRIDWVKPYTKIKDVSFNQDVKIRWFYDGTLNACANCIDRHLNNRGDQTAIIWEGDNPNESKEISYRDLHKMVCRFSNALRNIGAKKGVRVTIYMPMIPEAAVAMLACARIGAVHSVVFGGFSPDSLANRIIDCDSSIVITADEGIRSGKKIPL